MFLASLLDRLNQKLVAAHFQYHFGFHLYFLVNFYESARRAPDVLKIKVIILENNFSVMSAYAFFDQ